MDTHKLVGSELTWCPQCQHTRHTSSKSRRWLSTLATHMVVSFSTLGLLFGLHKTTTIASQHPFQRPKPDCRSSYSPANDHITYETVLPAADVWGGGLYGGVPSHESDLAWNELQKVRGVWIYAEETSRLRIEEGLTVGNGTTATILGVQHNIHCLRYIHQQLHPNYYYPDQSEEERKEHITHAGHCLEAMRQSVMCTPDLTPRAVHWEDEEHSGIAGSPRAEQDCMNWESLLRWTETRAYTLDDLWEANP